MIDAIDGAHLWAERYDRALDDIFAIQDEITLVLATEMQVKLTDGEQARLHYATTTNVEAWTCWVQGLSHYRQAVTKEANGPARLYWEKALALDPDSASLNAMLGFLHAWTRALVGGTTAKQLLARPAPTPTGHSNSIPAMPTPPSRQAVSIDAWEL